MRVLITTVPFADSDKRPLKLLEQAGVEYLINPVGRKLTEQELIGLVSDFDVLIAGTEPITDAVLAKASKLKLITRVGIGVDSVDLLAARKFGVQVSYTPDAPSPAVAELTIGLMIDLLRFVHLSNTHLHHGAWYRYFGRRLSQVTIGIIGVGRIGSQVIRYLGGFECRRILVNDIDDLLKLPDHPTCTIERVDKEIIYKEADVISLHVPLTSVTRNLITSREISMMKRDSLLINTARGAIVNEQDLYTALETSHLGGAAIDVFEDEPYSGKLAKLDQCLLTAHMGSMSVDCRTRMENEASEEAVRFVEGKPLELLVPEAEYANQSFFC